MPGLRREPVLARSRRTRAETDREGHPNGRQDGRAGEPDCGVEARAGVLVEVLSKTVADQEFGQLIDFRELIASSASKIMGYVEDESSGDPVEGVTVTLLHGSLIRIRDP